MNSRIPTETPIYRLMLISAALLISTARVLAADVVDDAQMQARALLTGTSGSRPKAADHRIATPTDGRKRSNIEPQEQARQFILGASDRAVQVGQAVDTKSDITPAVSAREKRVYADALEAARRMILGLGA